MKSNLEDVEKKYEDSIGYAIDEFKEALKKDLRTLDITLIDGEYYIIYDEIKQLLQKKK